MTYEPTWSQPLVDWQQTGSYLEPAAPPALPPGSGVLVQLPCVNEDWLPLILGCLDQLRNPSSWLSSLTDPQRFEVLAQADDLRRMVAMAINVPCCNVAMRFTAACELQFSVDGGTTWTTVAGWDANFGNCVRSSAPVPVPTPLQAVSTTQQACNVADFLAIEFIQRAVQNQVSQAEEDVGLLQALDPLIALLAPIFPLTMLALTAFSELYQVYVTVNLPHWQAAQDDPVLWDAVKCCIYTSIVGTGYVTASTYPTIGTCIAGISYVHPDVVAGVAAVWDMVGLTYIQGLQQLATAASGDCSECGAGSWCLEWDFATTNGGFFDTGEGYNTPYVGGQGWRGGSSMVDDCNGIAIEVGWNATPAAVTELEFDISCAHVKCVAGTRFFHLDLGATIIHTQILPDGVFGEGATLRYSFDGSLVGSINFYWPSAFEDPGIVLSRMRMKGTGTAPVLVGAVPC